LGKDARLNRTSYRIGFGESTGLLLERGVAAACDGHNRLAVKMLKEGGVNCGSTQSKLSEFLIYWQQ
jgi:hypothetical protein